MDNKGHELTELNEGDVFGEIEILEDSKRQYFAATKTDALLFTIKTPDFIELVRLFPKVEKYLRHKINMRIKQIKKCENKIKKNQQLNKP